MDPMNTPETADTPQRTPGQRLRAAREARGLHLAMLSVTLKVPVRQLEALENDQYDAFRGPAFVRAVAQAMCRHLGLDPAPVLAGLPSTSATLQVHPAALASPHQPPAVRRLGGRKWPVSPQVLGLGALMLAGSAALLWWPAPAPREVSDIVVPPQLDASSADLPVSVNVPSVPQASAEAATGATTASASAPVPTAGPPSALTSAPNSAPTSAPSNPSASAAAAGLAAPAALPASAGAKPPAVAPASPAASAVPPAPAGAASSGAPRPAGASGVPAAASASGSAAAARPADMQIAASGETWLEVRDARGQLVINRLLKAGETQAVELAPPYSVVIGRAHLAKVTRAGKDVDLAPHTKVSTARFEVQP